MNNNSKPPKQLFSEAEIAQRVADLAKDIHDACQAEKEEMLLVGLLKGSFIFVADLIRALDRTGLQPKVDFIRVSSYGNQTVSSGNVKINLDHEVDVRDRHVLLVDDIVDSGRTLQATKALFLEQGASAVTSCTLLDKPSRRAVECSADIVGFTIEDLFVVGYGIDYAEQYRHLPYIGYIES